MRTLLASTTLARGLASGAGAQTIVDVAAGAADFSTLVAAVTAADLAGTLSGPGPFTVFAPTDAAFAALPADTVAALLEPQNRDRLAQILTCHAVAGEVTAATLVGLIEEGHGSAEVETVGGCRLTASLAGGAPVLTDEQGRVARITATDLDASNGVIHVIDQVVLPSVAAQGGMAGSM